MTSEIAFYMVHILNSNSNYPNPNSNWNEPNPNPIQIEMNLIQIEIAVNLNCTARDEKCYQVVVCGVEEAGGRIR